MVHPLGASGDIPHPGPNPERGTHCHKEGKSFPDWITHVSVGWLILEALREKEYRIHFLVGCVLPDIEKLYVLIGLIAPSYEGLAQAFFEPTHTLIGALLLSVISTLAFRLNAKGAFANAIKALFLGAMLHLAIDSLIYLDESKGLKLLWPMTSARYGISLFHLGDWRVAAATSLVCLLVTLLKRGKMKT